MSKVTHHDRDYLFREAPVWNAIFTTALPSVFSMLVMVLYNMADMFFVGLLGDNAQVAAVSLVAPVFSFLMAIASMLSGGSSTLIAAARGKQDMHTVRRYSSLVTWSSIVFGLVFAAVILSFTSFVLDFLGANEEMRPYANMYLCVISLGAPVMIFTTAYGGVIKAEGAIRESFTAHMVSTVSNFILDPIFVLYFRLGVGGAAIATVISNVIGASYIIHYLLSRETSCTLSPKEALKNPLDIRHILATGLPNFISSTLVGFASTLANQLLVQYGTIAVAAKAAAGRSTTIISMTQMGIAAGTQPLIAYNYGAKNVPRIKELFKKISLLTVIVGLCLTVFCVINQKFLVSLFLKDPEALALGQYFIRFLVLTGPILGPYYLSSYFLQAIGHHKISAVLSLLRQGILLIPLLYIMNAIWGITGNIWAHIFADILATSFGLVIAIWKYRKL